jgi:ABC-type branched-subunit amino acid transport system substrate-binding protein
MAWGSTDSPSTEATPRATRRGALGGALAFGTLGGAAVARPRCRPVSPAGGVTVGVAVDLSGPWAPFGRANHQAAAVAVDHLATAGVLAGPVALRFADTGSTPETARTAVRRLVDGAAADVVVVGGATARLHRDVVGADDAGAPIVDAAPTAAQRCDPALAGLLAAGAGRVALVGDASAGARAFHERLRAAVIARGGEVMGPPAPAGYAALAHAVLAAAPDVVACTLPPWRLVGFLRALYRRGASPRAGRPRVFCSRLDEKLLRAAPDLFDGVVTCQDYVHGGDAGFARRYDRTARRLFGAAATGLSAGDDSATLYRQIRLYGAAVAAAGGVADGAAVVSALRRTTLDGVPGGPVVVRPGLGRCAMAMTVAVARQGRLEVRTRRPRVEPRGLAPARPHGRPDRPDR